MRFLAAFAFVLALHSSALHCCTLRAADHANPFDGKSLDGWMTVNGDPVGPLWEVADGVIHLKPKAGSKQSGGNIVTRNQYGDFSLSFEWKISKGGNSGIKYRVRDYNGKTLGLEYQIYDDVSPKKPTEPKNQSSALYDLYEPSADKELKPVGEWNTGKIVVCNNRIEHWLNGKRVVTAYVGSQEWNKRIAESKFDDIKDFARNRVGRIMLTDHGSDVRLRNVKFETLAPSSNGNRTRGGRLRRLLGR